MRLSIVIPAHNEEKTIGKCLSAIKKQKSRCEVIVVNDGSTDDTAKIAKKFAVKIINFNKGHSAAFARNAGASRAKGEYLVFIDADMIAEKTFIEKIEEFLSAAIDGSDYLVYSYKPKTIFQKAWSCYRKCYPSLGFPHIIRKNVFKKLKGFNEKIFYFEDEDLKKRFLEGGFKFKGPTKAKVYHIEVEQWKDFVRQRKWAAKGLITKIKRERKYIMLRHFLPCILLPLCYLSVIPLLIYFIYFWVKYSLKAKNIINSFLWTFLDFIGRFITIFYFIKLWC